MPISKRDLISAAVPLSASLLCGPVRAASATPRTIATLRGKLRGRLFAPTDPGYDRARIGEGATPVEDRFPALVVQPDGPIDIAHALDFARTQGLDISVRSGGHDTLGASTTPTGVVIDLSAMSAIAVDPARRVARAGAGARSAMLTAAGDPHGLAPILGLNGHVGLGGLTLGGGIGWLSGSYGAAVDHLLAVEIVTADGRFLRASARDNPDLFWALRGGGGNFGVATAFTYRMQPLAQVLAGTLSFKTDVPAFLRFLRGYLAESPDALDLAVGIPVDTPRSVIVKLCWSGKLDEGERVIGKLKAFSAPVSDTVKAQSYAAFVDPQVPAALIPAKAGASGAAERQFWRGGELDALDDRAIDAISAILERGGPASCQISVMHYMHGALCRAPVGATPFIRTTGHMLYHAATAWHGDVRPQEKADWVVGAVEQLRSVNSKQTYVNYLSYTGAQPVRDTYGPYFTRLGAIKRRYDPENVFHNNRNIKI